MEMKMEFTFTEENNQRIDKEISKYPFKQAAIMATLYIAQEQNGWISNEVMQAVAKKLDIHIEDVLGVVSFYTMYFKKPMGKYHLQVCTNVSCMLRGAYPIFDKIREKLGINHHEVTPDSQFSLEEVECMGSCGTAPMMAINEDFYENLSLEQIDTLIDSFKNK